MLISLLIVGLGGFFGAIFRMLLAKVFSFSLSPFWSICFINCIGCFGFGLVTALPFINDERIKDFLLVGFMGSFTTYSTYAFLNYKTISSGSSELVFIIEILFNAINYLKN